MKNNNNDNDDVISALATAGGRFWKSKKGLQVSFYGWVEALPGVWVSVRRTGPATRESLKLAEGLAAEPTAQPLTVDSLAFAGLSAEESSAGLERLRTSLGAGQKASIRVTVRGYNAAVRAIRAVTPERIAAAKAALVTKEK